MAATQSPDPSHRGAEPTGIPGWFKSSYSNGSMACIAVNRFDGAWLLADTKQFRLQGDRGETGPFVRFHDNEWRLLVDHLEQGREGAVGGVSVGQDPGGGAWLQSLSGDRLAFTASEIAAFLAGVAAGEFDVLVQLAAVEAGDIAHGDDNV